GSHLLEELIKNKNLEIAIVDDLSTGKLKNLPASYIVKGNLFIGKKIQDWKTNEKFDIIYHLAAKANTRANGTREFEDNIMATEAVCKLLKSNGRIIFSSSCAVYGNQRIVTEESPYQPISLYGYSKWMNELTIKANCKNYTIFRFSNVFGERQNGATEMGLVGVIEYNLKNNTKMKVFNEGANFRDYIYVKDVVNALINVKKKEIYQIGRNTTYMTLDLVKTSGVKWTYGANNTEVDTIKLDNSKLLKTGWKPTLNVVNYIGILNEKT
ncbi:hypothetical protein LCGC14_2140250, partial [marine sediment metagenome]